MPEYDFKACDRTGRVIVGTESAEQPEELLYRFHQRHWISIYISEQGSQKKTVTVEDYLSTIFPVSKRQLLFFYDQLASLLDSGISIIEALTALEVQISNKRMRRVLQDVIRRVEGGLPFYQAMKHHEDVFGILAVKVIESGGHSGKMELSIAHLAEMMEFELEISNRLKETTRYPKIVMVTLALAGLVLLTMVLPKFTQLFQKAEIELPWMTRLLILLQQVVMNGWGWLFMALLFLITLFLLLKKNPSYALAFERFRLCAPLIGSIEQKVEMSRVFRVLSVLLESGVDILTSLQLASQVSRFQLIAQAFVQVKYRLEEGDSISNSLKSIPFFPKMFRRMIMLGDQSGKLNEALEKISNIYEQQATAQLKNLNGKIEPLLIVMIGFMIIVFALGIFLPMWDLIKVLQ